MEPAVCWASATQNVAPWVPVSRHPSWSKNKVIYWRCSGADMSMSAGHIVDPQLPALGQHGGERTFLTTTEKLTFVHDQPSACRQGQMYVFWGCLAPVWHQERGMWIVQLPSQTSSTGYCRMLGQTLTSGKLLLAELCCGHMGGWHAATDVMQNWETVLALDSDPQAIHTYAANYGGTVFQDPHEIKQGTLDAMVLCHDLKDFTWLQALNHKDATVFSLSAPCQSWSVMGPSSGTLSSNGQVMTSAVQCFRLVQPPVVMMEQVQGFRQHSEYDAFSKL